MCLLRILQSVTCLVFPIFFATDNRLEQNRFFIILCTCSKSFIFLWSISYRNACLCSGKYGTSEFSLSTVLERANVCTKEVLLVILLAPIYPISVFQCFIQHFRNGNVILCVAIWIAKLDTYVFVQRKRYFLSLLHCRLNPLHCLCTRDCQELVFGMPGSRISRHPTSKELFSAEALSASTSFELPSLRVALRAQQ